MSGRAVWMAVAFALAGLIVIAVSVRADQPVSVGTALGALLLLSAAVRLEIARRG